MKYAWSATTEAWRLADPETAKAWCEMATTAIVDAAREEFGEGATIGRPAIRMLREHDGWRAEDETEMVCVFAEVEVWPPPSTPRVEWQAGLPSRPNRPVVVQPRRSRRAPGRTTR